MLFFKDSSFSLNDFKNNSKQLLYHSDKGCCSGDPSFGNSSEIIINKNNETHELISIVIQNTKDHLVTFLLNDCEYEIEYGCGVEINKVNDKFFMKIINFPL